MTTALSDAGLQFADGSVQSNAQVGLKNRIINGGFILNQRGYVSGTALAAGAYGHDRFKGGVSGGTYTFTQGTLGVNTTLTITAGTLVQVIEGCNVAEGGTYVLSWTGTAQARLNGGTFGASGTVTVTGWVAGTNLPVEFGTGTCGNIQLEKGSTATSFDYRSFGTELQLAQRYYYRIQPVNANQPFGTGMNANSTTVDIYINFPVTLRTTPTSLEQSGTASQYAIEATTGGARTAALCLAVPTFYRATTFMAAVTTTTSNFLNSGSVGILRSDLPSAFLAWSAEL